MEANSLRGLSDARPKSSSGRLGRFAFGRRLWRCREWGWRRWALGFCLGEALGPCVWAERGFPSPGYHGTRSVRALLGESVAEAFRQHLRPPPLTFAGGGARLFQGRGGDGCGRWRIAIKPLLCASAHNANGTGKPCRLRCGWMTEGLGHRRMRASTSSRLASISSRLLVLSRLRRTRGSVLEQRTLNHQVGYSTLTPSSSRMWPSA